MQDNTFLRSKKHNLHRGAQKRGLTFKLSSQEIQKILSNPVCHYCKIFCDMEQNRGNHKPNSFTFERLDPLLGYEPGNVVCACSSCNTRKSVSDQNIVIYREKKNISKKESDKRRKNASMQIQQRLKEPQVVYGRVKCA